MNRRIVVESYLPGPPKQMWNADAQVYIFDKFVKIEVALHNGGYLIIQIDRPLIID